MNNLSRLPDENNSLTETTYLIMLSLVPQPRHGYAIMKEVTALSESRIHLSTGTLYGAINRLLEQGWIERVKDRDVVATKRERKEYQLTGLGHAALQREVQRLNKLVQLARLQQVEG